MWGSGAKPAISQGFVGFEGDEVQNLRPEREIKKKTLKRPQMWSSTSKFKNERNTMNLHHLNDSQELKFRVLRMQEMKLHKKVHFPYGHLQNVFSLTNQAFEKFVNQAFTLNLLH